MLLQIGYKLFRVQAYISRETYFGILNNPIFVIYFLTFLIDNPIFAQIVISEIKAYRIHNAFLSDLCPVCAQTWPLLSITAFSCSDVSDDA